MALKPARLQWSDAGALESLDYGDVYFQRGQGIAESDYVFLQHNRLRDRFPVLPEKGHFAVLELGFGAGLNFLLTADLFIKTAPASARLTYVSIEKHPVSREMLAQVYAHWPDYAPLCADIMTQYPPMTEGFHSLFIANGRIRLMLVYGDVTDALPHVTGDFDAVYLDGFARKKNPDMWAAALYPHIAARMKQGATLATFSAVGDVRRGLEAAGIVMKKIKGFGIKRKMLTGEKPGDPAPVLSPRTVAVLGGGVAGCAAARMLALRGHKVLLIEKHAELAAETSGNPIGILYPKMVADDSPMGLYHRHGFCFSRAVLAAWPVDSWRMTGVRHLAKDADERTHHETVVSRRGYPEDFARVEADGSLLQPSAGMLSPPQWCRHLADGGNMTRLTAEVSEIRRENNLWQVMDAAGNKIASADTIVVAAGWASKDVGQLSWLPLQPLRGQMTMLRATAASETAITEVICHDGYVTPPVEGVHYAGATFQKEAPEKDSRAPHTVRAEDDAENVAKLAAYVPQAGLSVADVCGSRAGFRVTTPDKLPLAGPVPDRDGVLRDFAGLRSGVADADMKVPVHAGLYVLTGFGAHGLSGAPLAADMVAAMISGDPLPVPAALLPHFDPVRFILRDLKRKKI